MPLEPIATTEKSPSEMTFKDKVADVDLSKFEKDDAIFITELGSVVQVKENADGDKKLKINGKAVVPGDKTDDLPKDDKFAVGEQIELKGTGEVFKKEASSP